MRNRIDQAVKVLAPSFLGGILWAGCAIEHPPIRVDVASVTINGQPVHLVLDTGASSTMIYSTTARRVGLQFEPAQPEAVTGNFEISTSMSEPAAVTVNGQTFTSRIPVYKAAGTPREDGVIGWPEIRDDVLVFDPEKSVVNATNEFARQSGAWTKLRVLRYEALLLETPLAGGKTGVVLIDTGAPQGVQLSSNQWKEFRASHAQGYSTTVRHSSWSTGAFEVQTLQAKAITLGSLTLHDVPVEAMPPAEAAWLAEAAPGDEVVGILGMKALNKINLVVDGRNGFAYATPFTGRSDRGPKAGAVPENWTTGWSLHPNYDSLLLQSAIDYCNRGNFAAAIAEYNHALALDSQNPGAYAGRGFVKQIQGDFPGALEDYDQVINLIPDESIAARLHRQTLLRRLGRPPGDFATTVAAWPDGWIKTIGLFVAGQVPERDLLAEAKTKEQQCEAFYYAGLARLFRGDNSTARDFFQKSAATEVREYTEYRLALAELSRLTH